MAEQMQLYAQAAEKLRYVALREPFRSGLWERIGQDELAGGNADAAISAFHQARSRNELSLAGLELLAQALELREDWLQAALTRQELVDRSAGSAAAYSALVADYRRTGNMDLAASAAFSWYTAMPGDAKAAYQAAIFSVGADLKGAESLMEACARLDKSCLKGWEDLRQTAAQAGLSQDNGYQLTLTGRWLGRMGEWDLAELLFAQAVEVSPGYAEAWAFWGQAQVQNSKNGLPNLEKALQINPDSVLAHALLGLYWASAAQYERAIEQIQAVAVLEPQQAVWQVQLGNLTAADGDLVLARKYFGQAEKLEPDNPLVWEAMVRFSLTYQDDLRGFGLPAARRLVELRPDQASSLDLLGAVDLGLEDLRSAERFLQQALVIDPNYASAHLHIGQVYMQLKQNDLARDHLKKATELDGAGEVGKLARRILERYFGGG
jgi:tetratricopeptide (TPR) repeat protein